MRISYAITVCTERVEIEKLLSFLLPHIRLEDEIVVMFDEKNGTDEVWTYLDSFGHSDRVHIHRGKFEGHFADWKNYLTMLCSGDYIFNIDADEIPNFRLVASLPRILEHNPDVDVFLVPRENIVEGLTRDYIRKWGWHVDDMGRVNWPDYQWRVYRNTPDIQWINKVHERLDGFKKWSKLPESGFYSLYHKKTLAKQIKQNDYYDTLQS